MYARIQAMHFIISLKNNPLVVDISYGGNDAVKSVACRFHTGFELGSLVTQYRQTAWKWCEVRTESRLSHLYVCVEHGEISPFYL